MSYAKARRTKRSPASRMRPFWVLFIVFGVAVAGALVFFAGWSGFDTRHVGITGNRKVTTSEVLAAAQIPLNRSIWLENTGAIASRIERIPYVASVSIHRIPPASLRIVVRERVPMAVLTTPYDSAVVDRTLRVLEEPATTQALPALIVPEAVSLVPAQAVTIKDAQTLRDAYEAFIASGTKVKALSLDRYGDVVADLPGDVRLLLGDPEGLTKKLALANQILTQTGRAQRKVSALDLRAPGTPVVVYR